MISGMVSDLHMQIWRVRLLLKACYPTDLYERSPTVNRALPIDESWGTSPRSAVFLASWQQPAAFISVSSNDNWRHSIPCHFETVYSKPTSLLRLPNQNWSELKKKNCLEFNSQIQPIMWKKTQPYWVKYIHNNIFKVPRQAELSLELWHKDQRPVYSS